MYLSSPKKTDRKANPHLLPSGLACPETISPLLLSNALIQSLNCKGLALFNICALMHVYNRRIVKLFAKQCLYCKDQL